jgi:glutathione S-transferase
VIDLYQLDGAWGSSSVSPFCIKAEAYLRMSGTPFTTKFGDPRKGPRKKVPWIDDDGTVVSDSQLIIDHVCQKYGDKLDAKLSDAEKSRAHALRRMLEESTYWTQVWLRWGDDAGWALYLPVLRKMAPPVIGGPILAMIRRQMLKQLYLQGTGRRSVDEMFRSAIADYGAVASELGDKPYMFGDKPSSLDATVYAFLSSLLDFPTTGPLKEFVQTTPLVAYHKRIRDRFFAVAPASPQG